MSIKSILLFAGVALGHTFQTRRTKSGCGTPDPSDDIMEVSRQFGVEEKYRLSNIMARSVEEPIDVNVWLHSVASNNSTILTDHALQKQFDVLANVYASYGINMTYTGSTKTIDHAWAHYRDQIGMKKKLRKGGYADLNIYFVDQIEDDALGICTFPTHTTNGTREFFEDGCTVDVGTVPGGDEQTYNQGKTAIHEAGHWFGLFHTFQGGCDGAGDHVADTPAQESESFGCPVGRDSCPGEEGVDPVHNYMDYSDDACLDEFTLGQGRRMRSFWAKFRA